MARDDPACILKLRLTPARHEGYDAVREVDGRTFQIKGRCVLDNSTPSPRVGRINRTGDFDAVLLVLLAADSNATAIYEAGRERIIATLETLVSRARNERGQLGLRKFRSIGKCIWPADRMRQVKSAP